MQPLLVAALAVGVAIPVFSLLLRYRRYLKAASARVAGTERHVVSTPWGAVEYAERGSGAPVLVVHGIFQNCLSGLFSVRDLFADRRVIAPSRFGYLGSSMPPNATPAAQADALAALLDALDIGQIDVIGESASTKDDQRASHEARQRAAARIPGARFVSLESGGHLMLGQMKIVHDARPFLCRAEGSPRRGVVSTRSFVSLGAQRRRYGVTLIGTRRPSARSPSMNRVCPLTVDANSVDAGVREEALR